MPFKYQYKHRSLPRADTTHIQTMTIDFHCHSHCSDGALAPRALVMRAHGNGVTQMALTDHDQLTGLPEARETAVELGIDFINGVEISVTWRDLTVHIVGLNFDANHAELVNGLKHMADSRQARAMLMGEQLEQVGIHNAFEGALAHANGRVDLISRTHFARHLVAIKKSINVRAVFTDYLVAGKPGFVEHQWASLDNAVAWIRNAGGIAVIAHPGRYAHSSESELELIEQFIHAGGQGLEVVTGSHSKQQYKRYAELAKTHHLLASCGSDFHARGESKMDVGKVPALPEGLTSVATFWASSSLGS